MEALLILIALIAIEKLDDQFNERGVSNGYQPKIKYKGEKLPPPKKP